MFLDQQEDFSIREFQPSDFKRLVYIADAINRQAKSKEGFQPFYAFQVSLESENYQEKLEQKVHAFLSKAFTEQNAQPRSTYRLALCDKNGQLIGNVTVDDLPQYDQEGNKIQGDIGYFICPENGRNGLMSKALRRVLDIYFRTHDEMDLTIHPSNLYSIKMMQRFNAKVVGFKGESGYNGEPRMVLKLTKENFILSQQPIFVCSHQKVQLPYEQRVKNV